MFISQDQIVQILILTHQIVVDYSSSSNDPIFLNARLRVNAVSMQIAYFINSLISSGLTTHDQVVIVGHSLGKEDKF